MATVNIGDARVQIHNRTLNAFLDDLTASRPDENDWQLSASSTCLACGHDGMIPFVYNLEKQLRVVIYKCPQCKHREEI